MAAPHPLLLRWVSDGALPSNSRITVPMVDSAAEHGMAPLLDDLVRRDGLEGDHGALLTLAMHGLESAAATTAAGEALNQVIDVATQLGIEIALFKGLAIGSRWYPRPELRPSVDLDLFVDPSQSDRIGDLVDALVPNTAPHTAINALLAEGRVFAHDFTVDGTAIDLHFDPMNLVVPTRQQRLMWQRTERLDLSSGGSVRTLDLELSLVQALINIVRDDFADLLSVYDVSRMMDADPNWAFIERFAATEGWSDLLGFALANVCDILNRPPPLPTALTTTNDVIARLFWPDRIRMRGADRVLQGAQRQSAARASLMVTGRRREVGRAITRRVFPPRWVIEDRHADARGPYPVALVRWRRAQRAEIERRRVVEQRASQHAAR